MTADQYLEVPAVTVVVATYQRRDLLHACLQALLDQQSVDHEEVVVDDGSDDGTGALLADLARADDRLRWFRQPRNPGAAAARNRAWREARAPLVAFTDDDCVPTPGWVAALVAAADADVVQGPTLPNPEQVQHTYWGRSLTIRDWSRRFETCNLLVRRDLLGTAPSRSSCGNAGGGPTWSISSRSTSRPATGWPTGGSGDTATPRCSSGFPPASARSPPGGGCRPSASVPGRCATPCGNAPRRPDRSVPELLGRGVQELVGLTVETAWFTANSIRHRTLLL